MKNVSISTMTALSGGGSTWEPNFDRVLCFFLNANISFMFQAIKNLSA